MAKRNAQLKLLRDQPKSYGGELLRTREGRSHGRPLDTRHSMHLVLRSSWAKGDWSFWKPSNKNEIQRILIKFSRKYGVKIHSMANVGNHLHLHIKLSNRFGYKPFIRAITSAIAMAITGCSRINPLSTGDEIKGVDLKVHFWDYRPFTRVVLGFKGFLNLKNYIEINVLEGFGFQRAQARFFLKWEDLKRQAKTG